MRVPNTPAEARTGISDRVAAALSELATLRGLTAVDWWEVDESGRNQAIGHMDRIEQLLRAEAGR